MTRTKLILAGSALWFAAAAAKDNPRAQYNLGLLYVTQRNWNKALDAFDQGLGGALRPDWIEVWSYIYRGNCWDMIGQRERAVAEFSVGAFVTDSLGAYRAVDPAWPSA